MMKQITNYHAQFYAFELTRKKPVHANNIDGITSALSDAQVDLNPHQIQAALFAFNSPFSKGAILADEVGLGKTIEAGLLLSQHYAIHKRKLLIITPANLRKQWNQELMDKFYLPSVIMENKSFNAEINKGNFNPFDQSEIIIASFQFVKSKSPYIKKIPWDLVVIDEAHRLRNVYKPNNKIANTIKSALQDYKKILLTATPLQNSFLELYGLVSLIDENLFGNLDSFKIQYGNQKINEDRIYQELRTRIKPICQRTLRKQVLEYIKFTERRAICEEYFQDDKEQKLYNLVSDYLQRKNIYALPSGQRQLMTLILRKLLASSSFAIGGTLLKLKTKLDEVSQSHQSAEFDEEILADYDGEDELRDEYEDDEESPTKGKKTYTPDEIKEIQAEKNHLNQIYELANSITKNAKGEKLLTALRHAMDEANRFKDKNDTKMQDKAIIFTESLKTQQYIYELLQDSEFKNKIVLFNGSNNDEKSKEIYKNWLFKHKNSDKITGSATADKRAALVDYFRDEANIMIATEAAAEGINLQFCNLIVNFDMPWNPQRVEQRIGRCHRYGQKYDVIVLNFVNKENQAECRIYELLDEKFKLFSGVFGASDEILGTIESGTDFEKRVMDIIQKSKTSTQIQQEFDFLQSQFETEIKQAKDISFESLMNNFDPQVLQKIKIETNRYLKIFEQMLWDLSIHELKNHANFNNFDKNFQLNQIPTGLRHVNLGLYSMAKNQDDGNAYRIHHPLAQFILEQAKMRILPHHHLTFQASTDNIQRTPLQNLIGQSGELECHLLTIKGIDTNEYIIFAGLTDDNLPLTQDQCTRLFQCNADDNGAVMDLIPANHDAMNQILNNEITTINTNHQIQNNQWYEAESDKIQKWADDMKTKLRREYEEVVNKLSDHKKLRKQANGLNEKLRIDKEILKINQELFAAEDNIRQGNKEITEKHHDFLDEVQRLISQQDITHRKIFSLKFTCI